MAQHAAKKTNNLLDFDIRKARQARLKNPELNQAIFSLIAFFEDRQIRDREGKFSSLYHSSESSFASKSRITLWPLFFRRSGITIPMFLKVRNMEGEWASHLHALPELNPGGNSKKSLLSVQDSNMFITGFCLFPLISLNEERIAKHKRVLQPMIQSGLDCIQSFERGDGYNFWPQQAAMSGDTPRVGPLNIWVQIVEPVAQALIKQPAHGVFKRLQKNLSLPSLDWIQKCLTDERNAGKTDAIFNIANDANDTSLAIAIQYLAGNKSVSKTMASQLKQLSHFRDINRTVKNFSSAFETWKPENSGAFLTWLKEEDFNPFLHPENGLIPGSINNVDAVVNANVLFTLSLLQKHHAPGYQESIQLICKVIEEKHWPEAGLYYPQRMMFPYAVSRAVRDGGAQSPELNEALKVLLNDLLNQAKKRKHAYFFEGGKDSSSHFSTALGLSSLLNIGEKIAKEINQEEKFNKVVEGCVNFLLKEANYQRCVFDSTRVKFSTSSRERFVANWEDGLFFGPVHWDLCHWRSQAVTHAAILEAFSKYLLAFDKSSASGQSELAQLAIRSYDIENMKDQKWLRIIYALNDW